MKKTLLLSGLITGAVIITALPLKLGLTFNEKAKSPRVTVGLAEAFAARADDACNTAFKAVVTAEPAKGTYAEPVLDHLHAQLYRFNNIQTADVEMIFCRLISVMKVDPTLPELPQTVTKTDPQGGTVTVTVTAPTETFATTNSYTGKAELSYTPAGGTSTTFMTLWWAGSGTSSKGYLIQAANPMHDDGMTRLRYVQWDRTSDAQIVKIFGTEFATSYLGSPAGASDSTTGGDTARFGRISYNTTTKAVEAQSIEIRTTPTHSDAFRCVRTAFSGTMEGTITGYRPAKGEPEDITSTSTDGTDLDGITGVTDSTTATATQEQQAEGSALTTTFDYSCNDIGTAGATGKPFAGNTVTFTADPTTIFPN